MAPNLGLTGACAAIKEGASGEDDNASATATLRRLELCHDVLQEQHGAIADPRQLRTKTALEPFFLVLTLHGILVFVPGLAKRRVTHAVVEALISMLIIGQDAAQLDVLGEIPAWVGLKCAQQHAGQRHCMRLGLKLLAVRN